ncbi:MAG: TldD/PmbA family protein, partial [Proteobacteria bacterium]|nr:TldD/PmbA family protein [Pseudomonadota bacterium]
IGDKASQKEWAIGKKVANEKVSIIDYGGLPASCGYIPYDDEGVPSCKTYLIKNGILSGRLHTLTTASLMGEKPTGNGRSVDAEHEPIARMTNTYLKRGEVPFEDMISDIKLGVYIKTVKQGFGMSTFTLTPGLSYMIRNGKIAEPVIISAVAGSVFETLESIDAVSNDFKLIFNAQAGCVKLNQPNLPVGFGGPKIRVKSLDIS